MEADRKSKGRDVCCTNHEAGNNHLSKVLSRKDPEVEKEDCHLSEPEDNHVENLSQPGKLRSG